MVARLIIGLIILPIFIFARRIYSQVNRNQVNMGDNFTLNLI